MNNTVNCDKCHANFKIKIKKKNKPGGIEVTYFSCPKCFEKYNVSVFDAECRKMQRDIRAMQKEYQGMGHRLINGELTDEEYVSRIDSLDQERKEMISRLEERHQKLKGETL